MGYQLIGRYVSVALSVAGSAILLIACGADDVDNDPPADTILSEYSENATIIKSKNGQRSLIFSAPLVEGYTLGTVPYREFREGVHVETFTTPEENDSLSVVDVILDADYAIFYENRQLWEARGNVVVQKMNEGRTTLYTQQLFWNIDTKRVYSNVDSKLVENGGRDVAYGDGFESDDRLEFPRWRKGRGMMTVNVAGLKHRHDDDDEAGAGAEDGLEQDSTARQAVRRDVQITGSRPPVGKVGTRPGTSDDKRRPSVTTPVQMQALPSDERPDSVRPRRRDSVRRNSFGRRGDSLPESAANGADGTDGRNAAENKKTEVR